MTETPERCLYCDAPATSLEHIVPQGIGGHFARRILCTEHNNMLSQLADDVLVKGLAVIVHMLKSPKQRGGVGVKLKGKSAGGLKFTLTEEHLPVQDKLLSKNSQGKIEGIQAPSLEAIGKQLKSMGKTLDDPGIKIIEIVSAAPEIQIEIGLHLAMIPGVVKIAEHFAATQGAKISQSQAIEILRRIEDPKSSAEIVFPLLPDAPVGDYGHEVIAYPAGDDCIVTVQLFGVYRFGVLLKGVTLEKARRYYQDTQTGAVTIGTVEGDPPALKWPTKEESGIIDQAFSKRFEQLSQATRQRDGLRMLEVAHKRAFGMCCKEGSTTQARFLELLEHELNLMTSSKELINWLMDVARSLPSAPLPPKGYRR